VFYFAYDGSIHGDWISHYAVQLAAAHPDRVLNVVHVLEPEVGQPPIEDKLQRIAEQCERVGVTICSYVLTCRGGPLAAILSVVPPGSEQYLLCGTRARPTARGGFLSGTISQRLLQLQLCNVLAIRVVQPGLLGLPRCLLLPVAGHPAGFRSGLPFLRLFGPQILQLHLMLVVRVGPWRLLRMSHQTSERLRQPGGDYCQRIEREISEQLGLGERVADAQITLSDDVPREIVIAANRTRSRLIYMGASQRSLPERFFRGNPIERVLRDAACDVAIYRGVQ
jgi:hypothetical protein